MPDREPQEPPAAPERPSKSQRKRELAALAALAERLAALPESQRGRLPLSAPFREGIALYRRLPDSEARRRQLRYLARRLAEEEDRPALETALAALDAEARRFRHHLRVVDQWCERLLAEGDAALGELLAAWPDLPRQEIRSLMRAARAEPAPGPARRRLFERLRRLTAQVS